MTAGIDWITIFMSLLVALSGICAAVLGVQAAGAVLYGTTPNTKVTSLATIGAFGGSVTVILLALLGL